MLRLSDIMTRDVATVTPQTTLREAVELFTNQHISGAPVVAGGKIVGVVASSDILDFAASVVDRSDSPTNEADGPNEGDPEFAEAIPGSYFTELFAEEAVDVADRIEQPGAGVLDARTVDDVMTRDAIVLSPNDSIIAAADLMRTRSIHRVLVAEHGRLVGIVSTLDVVRAVADHKLTTTTYVFRK